MTYEQDAIAGSERIEDRFAILGYGSALCRVPSVLAFAKGLAQEAALSRGHDQKRRCEVRLQPLWLEGRGFL